MVESGGQLQGCADELRAFVSGIRGAECGDVRALPGSTLILGFGPMIPLREGARTPRERGAWTVVSWYSRVRIEAANEATVEGDGDAKDRLAESAAPLKGMRVRDVVVDEPDLVLGLVFEDGSKVAFVPVPAEEDEEQWSVLSPYRETVTVTAPGRWTRTQ